MIIRIEEGKHYVRESDDKSETYIMLVIPKRSFLPESIFATETLALHSDMTMWENDWTDIFFDREATPKEIEVFQKERAKYGGKLKGIGEMLTGLKVDF